MKQIIFGTVALIALMSLTACSDAAVSENTSDTADTASEVTVSSDVSKETTALNSADYVLNCEFTPIYEDVQFSDMSATGGVSSYEELQEYMTAYSDISFVGYEIIYQYSPEEAVEKTGSDIFKYSTTLYKAHIYYDYLHDTEVDMTVDLAKAGLPDSQFEGNPPYAIGQKIVAALSGYKRTRCVAIPELVYYVYDVNDVDLAYHVGNEDVSVQSAEYVNLDLELMSAENSLITTTTNNPVIFTQKSTVDDLTQFIKQDWESRGYDFFDVAGFDYDAYPKQSEDEDVPVVE